MNCYKCRRPLPEGQRCCPRCGAQQVPDRAMLDAARAGDPEAAADLYAMAYDGVYYTLHAMLRDEDTVLDLVQDSFLRAFANLDRLQEPEKYRAWMKSIARNLALDDLRSKKPLLFSQMTREDEDLYPDFEDDREEHLPELLLDRQETARLVREILDSLPEDQRVAVALFYYEERSVRQIAQRLGVNENTVKSRLYLGRKKIESKVRSLERQGVKLYSASPLAFFLALLRRQGQQAPLLPPWVEEGILRSSTGAAPGLGESAGRGAAPASRAAARGARAAARGAGVKTAAAAAGRSLGAKIIAAVTALAILGGGAAGYAAIRKNRVQTPETAAELGADAATEGGLPSSSPAADELTACVGRWQSEDGQMELWIQDADARAVVFSLYAPGRAALDQVKAERSGESASFLYQDPFHKGDFANGSLELRNGSPVLRLTGTNMELPGGSEILFPLRSEGPDYAALYAPVLDAYREHESSGEGGMVNWYGDEPGYVHVGVTGVRHFGYAFRDLDRNGVPELLLGAVFTREDYAENTWLEPDGYFANLILDLYTLADGEPLYLVNSGDRYRYSLTDDGQIHYEGSSGAAYSTACVFRMAEAGLELTEGVCIDGGEDRCFRLNSADDWQHVNDTPISYEECSQTFDRLYAYSNAHLCLLQPLLSPLVPSEPAEQTDSELLAPYREVIDSYGLLLSLPLAQCADPDIPAPLLWHTLELRYSYYYDDSPFEPYYALYDVDGNGRPELFIGLRQQDGSVRVYEVYGSDGEHAFRICCDGGRGVRVGGGKLLFQGGEFFPTGVLVRLNADGSPDWLLHYGTFSDDPNMNVYDGDETHLSGYYDMVWGRSESYPYEELRQRYLYDLEPAEELLVFQPIPPCDVPGALSEDVTATRAGYAELWERYRQAAAGQEPAGELDEGVLRILRGRLSTFGDSQLCYAYFDGNCDGREELYVGYPFGNGERAVACYELSGGKVVQIEPARFVGLQLDFERAPWRWFGAMPAHMNSD